MSSDFHDIQKCGCAAIVESFLDTTYTPFPKDAME